MREMNRRNVYHESIPSTYLSIQTTHRSIIRSDNPPLTHIDKDIREYRTREVSISPPSFRIGITAGVILKKFEMGMERNYVRSIRDRNMVKCSYALSGLPESSVDRMLVRHVTCDNECFTVNLLLKGKST